MSTDLLTLNAKVNKTCFSSLSNCFATASGFQNVYSLNNLVPTIDLVNELIDCENKNDNSTACFVFKAHNSEKTGGHAWTILKDHDRWILYQSFQGHFLTRMQYLDFKQVKAIVDAVGNVTELQDRKHTNELCQLLEVPELLNVLKTITIYTNLNVSCVVTNNSSSNKKFIKNIFDGTWYILVPCAIVTSVLFLCNR